MPAQAPRGQYRVIELVSASGIVWALENGSTAVLHAYDATNLATELYKSNEAPNYQPRPIRWQQIHQADHREWESLRWHAQQRGVFGLLP